MGETVNETKRKSLRDALSLISRAIIITESVCDKEQDAMDNLPENNAQNGLKQWKTQ